MEIMRCLLLTALSSRAMASLINNAGKRVVYAAPGIQNEAAIALAELKSRLPMARLTVSLDFDERTLRMGYGSLAAVETLRAADIHPTHSCGALTGQTKYRANERSVPWGRAMIF